MTSPDIAEDALDGLLRDAAPDRSMIVDVERVNTIAVAARVDPVPARRKALRGPQWAFAILAASLATGLAAPAIADGVEQLSHTGRYSPPTTESDGSEWITSEGSDYKEYLASVYPTWLPLPASIVPADFKNDSVERLSTLEGEAQQSLFESTFENDARCMWAAEWLVAVEAEDQSRAAAAAGILRDSVDWPATVYVAAPNGGYLEYLESVAVAAETGDQGVVSYFVSAECSTVPTGWIE